MTQLSFTSVEFAYGTEPIIRGLTFSVDREEIVGFLGVNGAGKTTTFLLASGLLRPQSGQIVLGGVNPAESKAWTYKTGVMMSAAGLYPRLTVKRNLKFSADLYSKKIDIEEHLKVHGLEQFADKPASHLSQGYRRRLALARATIHQPEFLMLDEPADGLDPAGTEHLHQYLRAFRDGGGGILLTSHRLEEIEQLCDRVILLNEGVVELEGSPQELASKSDGRGLRGLVLGLQKRVSRSGLEKTKS